MYPECLPGVSQLMAHHAYVLCIVMKLPPQDSSCAVGGMAPYPELSFITSCCLLTQQNCFILLPGGSGVPTEFGHGFATV